VDFIKIHDRKLKIALTSEELRRYGITLAEFDYANVETKRALWQMLDEAKKLCGFDASGASLYVEVYPSRTGCCEIFISCLDKKGEETAARAYPVSFDESEEMIAASAALLVAGYREKSYLYRLCGRFYLILFLSKGEDALLTLSLAKA